MTITPDATTTKRTHRPKQTVNALPDPATKPRYCCAHSKGEPADAPHRVIVVDWVRWDSTRGAKGDHRIGYFNEATGRRGESWYASFKSGAEFWPAPPVVVAEKPTDPRNDAPPVDVALAIRDALISRLTSTGGDFGPVLLDLVRFSAFPVGGNAHLFGIAELHAALASVGAVAKGNAWRLSDGPPPGWEWRKGASDRWYLLPASAKTLNEAHKIAVVELEDHYWDFRPLGSDWNPCADLSDGQACALMACRRAGMFALPVAPTVEKPTDLQPVATSQSVIAPPVATATASHPTSQLPLTVAVHPVDLTRALALLERLTVAAETIAASSVIRSPLSLDG